MKFAIAFGASCLWFTPASPSQGLLVQKTLSNAGALAIANGALESCHSQTYKVSMTILDQSGAIKLQIRGDGTGPHTLEHSRRKAYRALTFKRTSAETAAAGGKLTYVPTIEGTVGAAGGVPIFDAARNVIGAIGVSGAPGGDKDEACANTGIAKIAEDLK